MSETSPPSAPASPWAEISTPVQGTGGPWEAPPPGSAGPVGLWATNPPTFAAPERRAFQSLPGFETETITKGELQALRSAKRRARLVTLLVLAAAGTAGYYGWNDRQRLATAVAQSESDRRALESAQKEAAAKLQKQTADLTALERRARPLLDKTPTAFAAREANARLAAELTKQLGDDKDAKDITVETGDDRVLVTMPQKALFNGDEGEPGAEGSRVLARLGKAFKGAGKATSTHQAVVTAPATERKLPKPARPKGATAPFTTVWELSGARAAAVARFLVEDGGFAAKQVAASTSAPQRAPAGRNAKPAAPDRIEIALSPARP